jgi:hypothetical protein
MVPRAATSAATSTTTGMPVTLAPTSTNVTARLRNEVDYVHPNVVALNLDRQPRSQVIVPAQSRGSAQVGGGTDDIAITAFLVLAPRLRSVVYPDNFKPNIQKYDSRFDPNIWLSTHYITVKAAGGKFDHMAAYFLLVMGDAPSLWLNNLPASSINS